MQQLLELNKTNKYSIHDLAFIFSTTKKIIIDELKKHNAYYKYCFKCNCNKPYSEFSALLNGTVNDGLQSICKSCRKIIDSSDEHKSYQHKYTQQNKSALTEYRKQYYSIPENKKRKSENNKYHFNRKYKTDPLFKLTSTFGNLLYQSIKSNKNNITWSQIVGYTVHELKEHLEQQFKPGMSWDNYGDWHIDHIRPISSFNIQSIHDLEFKECWSLKNLQPLWATDNMRKSNHIGPEWGNQE